MSTVSIKGLDSADVLAALYNASRPLGMGILHFDPTPMSREEAAQLLKSEEYFDYLKRLSPGMNEISAGLYDRDNGAGAAEAAISSLRNNK